MYHINLFTFLTVELFQKSYSASKKFRLPSHLRYIFYKEYFKLLQNILKPYLNKSLDDVNKVDYIGNYNSRIIWIFWWQGYSHMPLIVKYCISSIVDNSNGYKVILITKNNICKYVFIPNFIFQKVQYGYITLTHFSDILRFNLLNNYGGLWCDATIYCTSNIRKQYFDYLYTCGGYKDTSPKFVAGRWTGFLIGGNAHNALFQFMCNYFNLYWKHNKYQIAYFLIDLGLYYAYLHNVGNFKNYVNNIACYHNPNLFKLTNLLNCPFDLDEFKRIIKDTNMFKLTYKKEFMNKKGPFITFYNRIINGKLG